jgi:hypothetical protein
MTIIPIFLILKYWTWLCSTVNHFYLYRVFYRVALKAPHSSADPPPPGGVFANEEARLLSSSRGNDHGVSASFENGILHFW